VDAQGYGDRRAPVLRTALLLFFIGEVLADLENEEKLTVMFY
jgi:hypothetical protein